MAPNTEIRIQHQKWKIKRKRILIYNRDESRENILPSLFQQKTIKRSFVERMKKERKKTAYLVCRMLLLSCWCPSLPATSSSWCSVLFSTLPPPSSQIQGIRQQERKRGRQVNVIVSFKLLNPEGNLGSKRTWSGPSNPLLILEVSSRYPRNIYAYPWSIRNTNKH